MRPIMRVRRDVLVGVLVAVGMAMGALAACALEDVSAACEAGGS